MQVKVLSEKGVRGFVRRLLESNTVVGPVKKSESAYVYAELETADELALDYPITLQSLKKFFLPPDEGLFRFQMGAKPSVEPVLEAGRKIIFGAHPCDCAGTWLLDEVFSTDQYDEHYMAKRDRALIVGLDCARPCDEYAFCYDMKSVEDPVNFDLFLTEIGKDRYAVEVGTDQGAELLESAGAAEDATDADLKALAAAKKAKHKNFRKRISVDADELPAVLEQGYDHPVWEAIGDRCFSCGTCNLVCPTCYCFNVRDELDLSAAGGERKRSWDSCQLDSFAAVAGGENFREHRSERLRHRMFRKAKYLLEKYGRRGCVGCGRCDRQCVAKISSVETYNELAGAAKEGAKS